MDKKIVVKDFVFVNKTGQKIRGELKYNPNLEALMLIVYDRVGTVYIDANPDKQIDITAEWITEEGRNGEIEEDGEPEPGSTGTD
jgi:hypothetical protein